MKRLLTFAILLMTSMSLFAQDVPVTEEKDVTKFLGIPVDGTKSEMIEKLKEKGFVSGPYYPDILEGEFNGSKVRLHIVTNNNKVYRIAVEERTFHNEIDMKIRYNTLIMQFINNEKYVISNAEYIPMDEDISYQMSINKKRYEASFYQYNLTEGIDDMHKALDVDSVQVKVAQLNRLTHKMQERYNKSVWFSINESFGKYNIWMYYDNKYNQANGEDL